MDENDLIEIIRLKKLCALMQWHVSAYDLKVLEQKVVKELNIKWTDEMLDTLERTGLGE